MTLTTRFLQDFESNLVMLVENSYTSLTENLWWPQVAKVRPIKTRREILTWMLNTAQIQDAGSEGGITEYSEQALVQLEAIPRNKTAAFKIGINELEDQDANGIQAAAQWATDVGEYMKYWPQKLVTHLLKYGHTTSYYNTNGNEVQRPDGVTETAGSYITYDGKALFATDHPVNPRRASLGTYRNIINSVGVLNVPRSEALTNLSTVFSTIAGIKQANGEDPRRLRPKTILCGPKLYPKMCGLLGAKFIAETAGSGAAQGGSGDVTALLAALGYATPVLCHELDGFESDETYFVIAEQAASNQIGPSFYVEREPFNMVTYTGRDGSNVDLGRARELEWIVQGRNAICPGHPFLIFKCMATA